MEKNEKGFERLRPYQFKKGQSGNPGGRPKVKYTAEMRELASMLSLSAMRSIVTLLQKDIEELKQIQKDERASSFDRWMSTIIIRGTTKGEEKTLLALLERVCGRPYQHVNVQQEEGKAVSLEDLLAKKSKEVLPLLNDEKEDMPNASQ